MVVEIIVHGEKWSRSLVNVKEVNKKAVEPVHLLFYAHRPCADHFIAMLQLVSGMNTHATFCIFPGFVQGQPLKDSQQKHSTKSFARFHDHFPLIKMYH